MTDDDWSDPIPDGIRHTMLTDGEGRLSCCGRPAVSIPAGDAMTADPQRVTCTGGEAA